MRLKILVIALALALLCGAATAEGALSIVCTNFPCYDFARQVAGDAAEVSLLIHPGVEVHAYEPTPADILAISQADLFIYVGGESDVWVDNILASFDVASAPETLRMMDVVQLLEEEADSQEHGDAPEYDEHIWTSPVNAMAMVRATADALSEVDAPRSVAYQDNAEAYAEEIGAIDADIRAVVSQGARRELIFADRFPFLYFVREYGLDYVAAFPSCTADTEASPNTIMAIIQRVIGDKVPAIYTIELSTQAVARTVAEETGAEILTLHSMQTVTQREFEAGESYASIMRRNVEALQRGLR